MGKISSKQMRNRSKPSRYRVARPAWLEYGIQILNANRCCICQKEGIQHHHLDGNPSNNTPDNLAALCLDHHDRAEQAKGGISLTKALSPDVIRAAKREYERNRATLMGFASVAEFWDRFKEGVKDNRTPQPKYYAATFKDWAEWEEVKHEVGAYAGEALKSFHFCNGLVHNQLVAIVRAGIPSHDVLQIEKDKWELQKDNFIVPMKAMDVAHFALTTFDYVPLERQKAANERALEVLEKKRIYETVGVHAEYKINGVLQWPEGIREFELAMWLQYVALLQNYFHLLGDNTQNYLAIATEWRRIQASNLKPETWAISPHDGALATKVDRIIPLILGKGMALKDHLAGPVRHLLNLEMDSMLDIVVSHKPAKDYWGKLVEAVKTSISALVDPERAKVALQYPNPILHMLIVVAFHEGKFSIYSQTTTSTTPNAEKFMSPSKVSGACDLRAEFHDYFTIGLYPNSKPENPKTYCEELKELELVNVLRLFRKPFPPQNDKMGTDTMQTPI